MGKARRKVKEYINYRKENHPIQPSAGSTFKNIKDKKIAIGKLIEDVGLKVYKIGGCTNIRKTCKFYCKFRRRKVF